MVPRKSRQEEWLESAGHENLYWDEGESYRLAASAEADTSH